MVGSSITGKYATEIRYRDYGLTYHTICDISYVWRVCNRQTFLREMAEYFKNDTIFLSEVYSTYIGLCRNT